MPDMIKVDYKKRTELCKELRDSGKKLENYESPKMDKGSLNLNGVNNLEAKLQKLQELALNFGSVILKDAGILQNIADAFNKTDLSGGGAR